MKQFLLRTIKITALIVPVARFLMLIPYNNRIETSRIRNFYKEDRDTPIRKESGRPGRPLLCDYCKPCS